MALPLLDAWCPRDGAAQLRRSELRTGFLHSHGRYVQTPHGRPWINGRQGAGADFKLSTISPVSRTRNT